MLDASAMMPSHSRQNFEHTQWSLAMRNDAPQAVDAHEALVRLCLRYWYPIYAYLRRFGHGPASAQDITRSFLQHLFRHFRDSGMAVAQGRFRQYLLARLRAFLVSNSHVSPAGEVIAELIDPPPDLEARNQRDNASAQSPEQAYQQSFALELLARASGRLREEAGQTGRLDMYDALEPFLAADPSPAENEELARRLGTRTVTIAVAIRRLRQRFREVIDTELADTVASADELQAEQQALYAVLREGG
jgi:RNA polymerase sigma-70 factor (ECF subfamily)